MQIIIEKTFANKHKSVCGRKIRRETIEMARYVAYGKSEENKKNRWKHAIGGICQRLPTKYEIKTSIQNLFSSARTKFNEIGVIQIMYWRIHYRNVWNLVIVIIIFDVKCYVAKHHTLKNIITPAFHWEAITVEVNNKFIEVTRQSRWVISKPYKFFYLMLWKKKKCFPICAA